MTASMGKEYHRNPKSHVTPAMSRCGHERRVVVRRCRDSMELAYWLQSQSWTPHDYIEHLRGYHGFSLLGSLFLSPCSPGRGAGAQKGTRAQMPAAAVRMTSRT